MLTEINPKLPMRNKAVTREFYITKLGFEVFGSADYEGYLMVKKRQRANPFFRIQRSKPRRKLRTGLHQNR